MLLRNLLSVEDNHLIDISIVGDRIADISHAQNTLSPQSNQAELVFENAIVFPGLINSHDHLDFNSFPQLGNKIYRNYVEWGDDIHTQNKDIINKILKIPKHLRIKWGMYKNLINGITTVVNHGPKLQIENEFISVFQQCHVLHSIQLEKNWICKLNNPLKKKLPVVVHIGEGTDITSEEEIDKLIKWNIWRRDLIGIHGIAMNEKQAGAFKALVWCPQSNKFLIGKTADIKSLKKQTQILFGTDSTVSAGWNLWEHLQLVRQSKIVSDEELFEMLTNKAADLWNFKTFGKLKKDYKADMVIARMNKKDNAIEAFFSVQPEDILLVIHQGKIRLFDNTLRQDLMKQNINLDDFYSVNLNQQRKYVWGNLPALIEEIKQYYPEAEFPVN